MAQSSNDLNVRILASLLRYVLQRFGKDAHAEVLAPTTLTSALDGTAEGWVSHEQFEDILARARRLMSSDQEFATACVYKGLANYGPVLYVLRAGTVRSAYSVMVRTGHLVSRISKFSLSGDKPNECVIEYRSTKDESRLMCMSRQAQMRLLPSLWAGFPAAHLQEEACICRGDSMCAYRIRWAEPLRYRWFALGATGGAIAAFAVHAAQLSPVQFPLAILPLVGATLGLAWAYRELAMGTTRFQTDTTRLIEDLVKDRERAVAELRLTSQREQSYTDLLEERVRVRTAQLEQVIQQTVAMQEKQSLSLRGLSHDMRSPLQILTFLSFRLRAKEPLDGGHAAEEIDVSVRRLRDQLGQLAEVATNQPDAFTLRTTQIPLEPLAARVKAHLDALLLGRGVSASCFRTREAPETILSDPTIFDRIVDNIVTNAAKYTDRGSIVVEISGSPGTLSIKVSDTGRGISPDRLEHVFTGAEPDKNPAFGDSLGIGLANTVRLIDQVGGRLEVMSRPSMGTTVWIHIPVERATDEPESKTNVKALPSDAIQDVVRRVVRIRATH